MKNQLTKNFKDLPLEINLMIFDYLDVNTILKLRLLNKDFKKIIENVRIKSMNVTDRPFYFARFEIQLEDVTRFYFTNKLVNRTSSRFITTNTDLFKSNLMKILLSKIKILYIREAPSNKLNVFNLEHTLNNFKSIEQLQIESLEVKKKGVLKLPNLKILQIQNVSISDNPLKLDTPKLSHFQTQNIYNSYFKFIYPREITHLFLYDIPLYNYIEEFINLKSISTRSSNSYHFDPKIYFNFNKLEEIHMDSLSKNDLLEFIKDKRSKKLKFYLQGLLIESISDIDLHYNEKDNLIDLSDSKLISLNKTKLGLLPYLNEINYTNLLPVIDDIKDFYSKFIHCFKVKLDHTDVKLDQTKFIDFICRIDNLCVLEIENSSFDQSFYDNLFKYCPNLGRLDVDITERIDFNFLSGLKKLQKFNINQTLEFNILKKIINNLVKLGSFNFIFKNRNASCYIRNDSISFTFTDLRIGVSFKKFESFIRFLDYLINFKCNLSMAMEI